MLLVGEDALVLDGDRLDHLLDLRWDVVTLRIVVRQVDYLFGYRSLVADLRILILTL